MNNPYQEFVINKPWGYEYLIYESPEVALWLLKIEGGKQTSLHCHPKKTTGLILLEGEAELGFIADSKLIKSPSKHMIRRGLFHSTKALTESGILLLEIETPNDKGDLVRLIDKYGRSKSGYEKEAEWTPKNEAHVWIEEPKHNETNIYQVNKTRVAVTRISTIADFNNFHDNEIIMFLKGGVGKEIDGRNHLATVPGDIGVASIVKKVANEMEFCSSETILLRVSPDGSF
jgi:mannose-6-phosphate isomerase-like protein (cupin superfamily)